MPQSLARIYVHLVFSTKHRVRSLPDAIRPELHAYMGGILRDLDCNPICINTEPDHAHLLFELGRMAQPGSVTGQVKKGSTNWLRKRIQTLEPFRWQAGYGAFSIGRQELDTVIRYIANQRQHHRGLNFQAEFRSLCRQAGVSIDERYAWA